MKLRDVLVESSAIHDGHLPLEQGLGNAAAVVDDIELTGPCQKASKKAYKSMAMKTQSESESE